MQLDDLRLDVLTDSAKRVFISIAQSEFANDFLLIGGTALALQIGHRISLDLDFVFTDPSGKLPTQTINALIRDLESKGHTAKLVNHPAQESTFRINTGEWLTDYARDYAIDGVKVTFFAESPRQGPKRVAFWRAAKCVSFSDAGLNLLHIDACKIAKTLVLENRVRSRDLFDLMVLMRDHGLTVDELMHIAQTQSDKAADSEQHRLILRGLIPLDRMDEGLQSVGAQASIDSIYQFFDLKLSEQEARIHAEHLQLLNTQPIQLLPAPP
jgi:predicted nucleotidyltransferase component of viral defense system